jgi:glucose-1-phosphate thymidylyltransferase
LRPSSCHEAQKSGFDRIRAVTHRIGIVPAAGMASRLQPLPHSKELLSVRGRPVMDWLVERMKAAACTEIRVVTRPRKTDVAARAAALGATVVIGEPDTVGRSVGLGLSGVPEEATVLLGFPDTLWEPPDGFVTLLGALQDGVDAVLGLFTTDEAERSDVVVRASGDRVERILVKPREPPSNVIWGCAVARAAAIRGIDAVEQPGELFDRLARRGRVRGVYLSDSWLDIGTKEALARARRQ